MSNEIPLEAMQAIAESKLMRYRNTIYDQTIELRVMERVKDTAATKTIKEGLVRLEHIVDEIDQVLTEIKAEIAERDRKAGGVPGAA